MKKPKWEQICCECEKTSYEQRDDCLHCGEKEVMLRHWSFNEVLTQKFKKDLFDCGDCGDAKDVNVKQSSTLKGEIQFRVGCVYCDYEGKEASTVEVAVENWTECTLNEVAFYQDLYDKAALRDAKKSKERPVH